MNKSVALVESLGHIFVVLLVIVSATFLASKGDIKADTISTVYGAALGFATGALVNSGGRQRENRRSDD